MERLCSKIDTYVWLSRECFVGSERHTVTSHGYFLDKNVNSRIYKRRNVCEYNRDAPVSFRRTGAGWSSSRRRSGT